MKKTVSYIGAVTAAIGLCVMIFSCNHSEGSKTGAKDSVNRATLIKTFTKPPSTYPDTLIINFPAAVFYQPDSIQLLRIKAVADPRFYESSMHEYFYLMLTARTLLERTWPWLTIKESKKYRFLLFIQKNNTRECIDLDTKTETHGLYVFNGKKPPVMVDMADVETGVSFYLKE